MLKFRDKTGTLIAVLKDEDTSPEVKEELIALLDSEDKEEDKEKEEEECQTQETSENGTLVSKDS